MKSRSLTKKRGKMRLDRLVEARHAKGYTQQDVADKTGISLAQIQRYEKGKSDPTMQAAIALAKVYECSLDWLAGLSDSIHGTIRLEDLPMDQRRVIIAMRTLKDGPHKLQDLIRAIASSEELLSDG